MLGGCNSARMNAFLHRETVVKPVKRDADVTSASFRFDYGTSIIIF